MLQNWCNRKFGFDRFQFPALLYIAKLFFALQSDTAMTDLNRALLEISSIRRQMARTTEFRGYGPATLTTTGLLALAAAGVQARWVPYPTVHPGHYLDVWLGTAIVSASVIAIQTLNRARRMHSAMADEMIRIAVEQFLPAAGAGALVTLVLFRYVPDALWMLPGLWQIIFSLGVFASCRFLPGRVAVVGGWYLLTGLFCLHLGDSRALSPLAMGIPFAVGQLLVAAILYLTSQEESHAG